MSVEQYVVELMLLKLWNIICISLITKVNMIHYDMNTRMSVLFKVWKELDTIIYRTLVMVTVRRCLHGASHFVSFLVFRKKKKNLVSGTILEAGHTFLAMSVVDMTLFHYIYLRDNYISIIVGLYTLKYYEIL